MKISKNIPTHRVPIRELKPHFSTKEVGQGMSGLIMRREIDGRWFDVFLAIKSSMDERMRTQDRTSISINAIAAQRLLNQAGFSLPASMVPAIMSDTVVVQRLGAYDVGAFWRAVDSGRRKFQVHNVNHNGSFYLSKADASNQSYSVLGIRSLDPFDQHSIDLQIPLLAKLIYRGLDFFTRTEEEREVFEWFDPLAVKGEEVEGCFDNINGRVSGIVMVENDPDLLSLQKDQLTSALEAIDRKVDFINLDKEEPGKSQEFPLYTASTETGFARIPTVAESNKPFLFFMDGNLGYRRITGETIIADIRGESTVAHLIAAMSNGKNFNFEMLRAGADFVIQRKEFNDLFHRMFLL